jgi:hypothetical protein
MNLTTENRNLAIVYLAPNHTITVSVWEFYDQLGLTFMSTVIYLSLVIPLSVIGLVLTLIAFLILKRDEFANQPLFFYYRVVILASICLSCLQLTGSFLFCQRFWPLLGTYSLSFYHTYVKIFACYVLGLFRNLLDIVIVLDRIVMFEPRVKFFVKFSPLVNVTIVLVFAIVFNIPQIFVFKIVDYPVWLITEQRHTHIYGLGLSDFINDQNCLVLVVVMNLVRSVLCIVIQIVLNVVSIVLFVSFMEKKTEDAWQSDGYKFT